LNAILGDAEMKLRATMTSAWALLTGLAGGWLILSPWSLAEQPAGQAWAPATQTAVFTGLGLVVLAVIGLVAVTVQVVSGLRPAGALAHAARAPVARAGQTAEAPEFETTLVALAQALVADLASSTPADDAHERSEER